MLQLCWALWVLWSVSGNVAKILSLNLKDWNKHDVLQLQSLRCTNWFWCLNRSGMHSKIIQHMLVKHKWEKTALTWHRTPLQPYHDSKASQLCWNFARPECAWGFADFLPNVRLVAKHYQQLLEHLLFAARRVKSVWISAPAKACTVFSQIQCPPFWRQYCWDTMPLKSSETNMGEQERFDDFNIFHCISMPYHNCHLRLAAQHSCHRVIVCRDPAGIIRSDGISRGWSATPTLLKAS